MQGAGGAGAVGVSTGAAAKTVAAIAAVVAAARATEYADYATFGSLAEVKEASQAGMMWNVQWSPDIPGTFAPVSRGWGHPWVIFDWDNIFGRSAVHSSCALTTCVYVLADGGWREPLCPKLACGVHVQFPWQQCRGP